MAKKPNPRPPSPEDQRTAVRAPIDAEASLQIADVSFVARLRNVSSGGAFVCAANEHLPLVGTGIRIRFRLPGRVDIELLARVRWARAATATEPVGFGVEFVGLGLAEEKALREFVDGGELTASALPVTVTERYAVQAEGNTLRVWINGSLEVVESKDLGHSITLFLEKRSRADLRLFIDATRMVPCSDESLEEFRRWMQRLRGCGNLAGIVIARHAVAMLQMRRLARETGVGDSLACFTSAREGERFWTELEGMSPAAHA
jgi:hypothetical protein